MLLIVLILIRLINFKSLKMKKLILSSALVLALCLSFTSCREKKEADTTDGAAVENAVEQAEEVAADAAGTVEDAVDEATDAVEGAVEDAKEAVEGAVEDAKMQ